MSGQIRASSARKSRKSTVIPAIQQRRTPRRFGCDQRDQLRRERIQELWSAIDSRIKEFQVSSFASSSYSSDESGQVQTLVKSAVRRCPRMSRDKRGNRTQEVDGSSPFSSTKISNPLDGNVIRQRLQMPRCVSLYRFFRAIRTRPMFQRLFQSWPCTHAKEDLYLN